MKILALDFCSAVLAKSIKIAIPISWLLTKVSIHGSGRNQVPSVIMYTATIALFYIGPLFSDTPISEIEDCFKRFVKRDDIDIILINQNYAELIRHVIDAHTSPLPAVLEIPSKDHPYDASKDSILRRAKVCVQQWVALAWSLRMHDHTWITTIILCLSGHVQPRGYAWIQPLNVAA